MTLPRHSRSIWILSCGRIGDLKQMQALAQALAWPAEVKSPASLAGSSGQLPDLILCAEQQAADAALVLKARAGDRLKVVCLARPRGHFDAFDLIITTPQYELPAAANIMEVSLPLTLAMPAPRTPAATKKHSPQIVLLVGGTSPPFTIDAAFARTMAQQVKAYVAAAHGTLAGTTSARTGSDAVAVLARELAADRTGFHIWEADKPNPYAELLEQADEIIVTADSVSMLADGIAAGKPVAIYKIAEHWGLWQRLVRGLWRIARRRGAHPLASLLWPLFNSGLLEQRANRQTLHEGLVARGVVAWFGDAKASPDPGMLARDMEAAVSRVRGLFKSQER